MQHHTTSSPWRRDTRKEIKLSSKYVSTYSMSLTLFFYAWCPARCNLWWQQCTFISPVRCKRWKGEGEIFPVSIDTYLLRIFVLYYLMLLRDNYYEYSSVTSLLQWSHGATDENQSIKNVSSNDLAPFIFSSLLLLNFYNSNLKKSIA